jgi:Cupin domain
MAKVSRETADTVRDHGVALDRCSTVEGYTFNFVSIREDMDLAPMLASLPGGKCACPHWGVVLEGQMTVRYGDHEETFEAGDAFYMPPGHTPAAKAGTEFIQISPAEELAVSEAALAKAMQAG